MAFNYTYNTTLADYNTTDLAGLFTYAETAVTGFWSMILLAIWFIVTLNIYFAGRNRGRGDFLASATVGSWFVTVLSFLMSLVAGLISTVPILFALTSSILLTILLLLTSQRE